MVTPDEYENLESFGPIHFCAFWGDERAVVDFTGLPDISRLVEFSTWVP